ncbi:MAG: mechanosensitive ion channel family protein [Bacteroidota bacterium]|nr:mechanosensitive ion channel family protein [Bacteroidota bacterium]
MDWSFLDNQFLDNSLGKYFACGIILLLGLIFSRLIAKFASNISYRIFKKYSHARFHAEFISLFTVPFRQLFIVVSIYVAFNELTFPQSWNFNKADVFGIRWTLQTVFVIALIVVITRLFLKSVEFVEYVHHNLEESRISKDLATFLKELSKVLIYTLCCFTILAKAFEVNILTIVASLGIGGLAIALAAQDTLANLIGSFIIYLDKPFKVGDIVDLGEVKGVVEKIGFRTTRIRTLEKSLLFVPNKKIIDSNLNNITQSSQRRVKFTVGLTYQSQAQDILLIIDDIKAAIRQQGPDIAEDITVKFIDFDTSSLNILIIYFVNSNVYEDMIEVKQEINVKILEIVRRHGCEFAYPSQTIYIAK